MIIVEHAIEILTPIIKKYFIKWNNLSEIKRLFSKYHIKWKSLSEVKQLTFSFLFLFTIAIYFWVNHFSADFGLNAFTELLGVLITIIIVNRIYNQRDEKRRLPTRILVYRECAAMTNRMVRFWVKIHRSASAQPAPSARELLNQNNIAKLAQSLDSTAISSHTSNSLFEFFNREISIINSYNMRLLSQYAAYLSPRQLALVHELSDDSIFTPANVEAMASTWNTSQSEYSDNRAEMPTYFSALLPAPNYTYTNIVDLHDWLIEEYEILNKLGITWLEPPAHVDAEKEAQHGQGTAKLNLNEKNLQAKKPELIPLWKDVYGWQSTHPGNWWLQENREFNNPVVVKA